jgi:hypothetical protein
MSPPTTDDDDDVWVVGLWTEDEVCREEIFALCKAGLRKGSMGVMLNAKAVFVVGYRDRGGGDDGVWRDVGVMG